MRIRTEKLVTAIILFVTSVLMPVFIIVLSLNYPENLPIWQAIFMGILFFFIFVGLALFNYLRYKSDKEKEEYKTKRIKQLEKELKQRNEKPDQ